MTQELISQANEFGIEPKKVNELVGNLQSIKETRDELTKQYEQIIRMDIESEETSKMAKEIRGKIRDNRTKGISVWHKTTKDYYLRAGQFIDAIKRKEEAININMEVDLEQIEKHLEIKKAKEKQILEDARMEQLKPYIEFVPYKNNLADFSEEDFLNIYNYAKKMHDDKMEKDRIEAERLKEEQRRKEVTDRNYYKLLPYSLFIPKFNELDFYSLMESDIEAYITTATEQKQKAEQEAEQAKRELEAKHKEMEAERKKMQDKLDKERKEREKMQKELQERAEQEKKAKQEEEAKKKEMYDSGDIATLSYHYPSAFVLQNIAMQIKNMKVHISLITFENIDAKRVIDETCKYMDKVVNYIMDNADKLK
jgi:DNA repair exonuclease SbcCD ATPase subunit